MSSVSSNKQLPFWVQYEFAEIQPAGTYKTSHRQASYCPPRNMDIILVDVQNQLHTVYTFNNLPLGGDFASEGHVWADPTESEPFTVDFSFKAIRFSITTPHTYRNHYITGLLKACQLFRV